MSLHKQALWSILPLLVVTVLNLVSVPLFYHSLGANGYAIWLYVLTLSGAFGFSDLGLGVAVGRYVGVALGQGDRAAVESYWSTGNAIAIPLLLLMGIGFAAVGVSFGHVWFTVASENEGLLKWCFIVGGINLFLAFYAQFWTILSQAFLDFKFLSIFRVISIFIQIVPALALAHWTHDPLVLLCWSAVTGLAQLVWLMGHGFRAYGLRPRSNLVSRERALEMAGYTSKVFLNLLCGSISGTIDRLLVGKLAPPRDFTAYTIAANAGARIQSAGQSLMAPVFHNTNRVAAGNQTSAVRFIYTQAFDMLLGLSVLGTMLAVFWGHFILQHWLGAELATSVEPVFAPLIAAFALQAISSISSAQLASLDRQGLVLIFQILTTVLAAIGVWWGWHLGGARGAALGFAASRSVGIAQDLMLSSLIGGGGWAARSAWLIVIGIICLSAACLATSRLATSILPGADLFFLVINVIVGAGFVWIRTQNMKAAGHPQAAT